MIINEEKVVEDKQSLLKELLDTYDKVVLAGVITDCNVMLLQKTPRHNLEIPLLGIADTTDIEELLVKYVKGQVNQALLFWSIDTYVASEDDNSFVVVMLQLIVQELSSDETIARLLPEHVLYEKHILGNQAIKGLLKLAYTNSIGLRWIVGHGMKSTVEEDLATKHKSAWEKVLDQSNKPKLEGVKEEDLATKHKLAWEKVVDDTTEATVLVHGYGKKEYLSKNKGLLSLLTLNFKQGDEPMATVREYLKSIELQPLIIEYKGVEHINGKNRMLFVASILDTYNKEMYSIGELGFQSECMDLIKRFEIKG